MIGRTSHQGSNRRGPTGRVGESRAGVSLNGLLALVCGIGLLLVREALVSTTSPAAQSSVRILLWVAVVLLLVVGVREVLGRGIRRARTGVGRRARRVRRAPREGLLYLGLMAALLVGSFLGGDNLLMLVVALMIGPWLLNAWASDMLLWRCEVKRKVPDRVMAGEVLSVEVIVENRKRLVPSWLVLASDQIENDAEVLESQVLFARVPGGDCRSGYYRMRPGRRGRYRLGPIELSTRFPLGLIERGLVFHRPDEIRVYPRLGRLAAGWHQAQAETAGSVPRRARRGGGADDQLQRLREFRSGDNPKAVHWRTSARRGELMVREFDRHQHQHLDLVLDLWQPNRPTRDDRQRVELAVSLAATLCVETLRQSSDARVALTVWGEGVSELIDLTGPSGVNELLDLMATVRPGAEDLEARSVRPPVSAHLLGVLVTTRAELTPEWAETEGRNARLPVHVDPERLPSWFAIGEA
ncbi:MAG TPA: hypothetical protein DCE39_18525 [Planctomycetaceae bacterium]|nr:hypothetical protein [Planctomycetaceae bacterium]